MAEIGWAMFPPALKDDNTSHSGYFLPETATKNSHRANWGRKLSDWGSKTEKCSLTWGDCFLKVKVLLHFYLFVQVGRAVI